VGYKLIRKTMQPDLTLIRDLTSWLWPMLPKSMTVGVT
jgi:hypothetical protein